MNRTVGIFIENSNIYYGVKTARQNGLIFGRLDLLRLIKHLVGDDIIIHQRIYVGLNEEESKNNPFFNFLRENFFKIITKKVKKILVDDDEEDEYGYEEYRYIYKCNFDVEIAWDLATILSEKETLGTIPERLILVSGDSDFNYLIDQIRDQIREINKTISIEIVSTNKSLSSELRKKADELHIVEDIWEKIRRV